MKIAHKISLFLTLVGAILALMAVSIIYIAVRNNLEKEILQHLITAVQSRANHIETFFDDHKDAVEIMSSEPSFIEVLSLSKNNPEYDKKLETVSNRIKTLINVHKEIFQVNLLDKNGVVVVSTDEASVGFDRSADVIYLKAKEATYVRDINISEAAGIPVIGIAAPVLFNSEFLGVIIADLKAEELYKITLDRTGLGETGEIYLVNRDFYMISPSRFKEDVILKQKVDTVNARRWLKSGNKNHMDGLEKINVFPDYRGVNVLGTHAHIHEMQWGLLAEIDENEAYAPLKQITSIFVAILIVIPIAGWLMSIFFARLITRPVHRLHKGTEIIGKGNLEYKVGTDSKDEIGQLSRAFDKMTEDLKKTTASMTDLNREIDERKQAEESLRKSEEKYRTLIENAGEAIIVAQDGVIKFANPKGEELYGRSQEELASRPLTHFIYEEDREMVGERHKRRLKGEEPPMAYSFRIADKNGDIKWVELSVVLFSWDDRPATLCFMTDITERKQAEEQVKASLKEKEVLLSEIHHRVKNNMQVIISLLRLRADKIEDKKYADMFKEGEDRIRSMALVHEQLYQTKDFANIDFGEYIKSLAKGLFTSHGVDTNKIKLNIEIKAVSLDIENAIPCGLIINELVSNSLKYAFPQGKEGKISISLRLINGDEFELSVSDDGVGIPEDLDIRNMESMGLDLVTVLAEDQLDGKIDLNRTGGTRYHIRFKMQKYKARM